MRSKYGSENISNDRINQDFITISGKQVDEVGFDVIAQKLSAWSDLEIVSLNGLRISSHQPKPVVRFHSRMLPTNLRWQELDLSNNLFESWDEILDICEALKELKTLKVK